ncbi:MAG: hypothetical protein NTW31_08795 [Bacteroidetes bacterium]|nr:hypothetical protein [Bacteroidota bacterium]
MKAYSTFNETKFIISSFLLVCISSALAQADNGNKVRDIDGNVYKTVLIGQYEWMAENLKTTSYNNGIKIPCISDSTVWTTLITGAYCWYNNNENNSLVYGALYNWYALSTGLLCPDGWRVPTDEEWKILEGYADTRDGIGNPAWDRSAGRGHDAGQRLMAVSGWSSDGNGTDDLGFKALPGGERGSNGRYFLKGRSGFWWTSTMYNEPGAWFRNLIYGMEDINRGTHPKWVGFSVRCLRDK